MTFPVVFRVFWGVLSGQSIAVYHSRYTLETPSLFGIASPSTDLKLNAHLLTLKLGWNLNCGDVLSDPSFSWLITVVW